MIVCGVIGRLRRLPLDRGRPGLHHGCHPTRSRTVAKPAGPAFHLRRVPRESRIKHAHVAASFKRAAPAGAAKYGGPRTWCIRRLPFLREVVTEVVRQVHKAHAPFRRVRFADSDSPPAAGLGRISIHWARSGGARRRPPHRVAIGAAPSQYPRSGDTDEHGPASGTTPRPDTPDTPGAPANDAPATADPCPSTAPQQSAPVADPACAPGTPPDRMPPAAPSLASPTRPSLAEIEPPALLIDDRLNDRPRIHQ